MEKRHFTANFLNQENNLSFYRLPGTIFALGRSNRILINFRDKQPLKPKTNSKYYCWYKFGMKHLSAVENNRSGGI